MQFDDSRAAEWERQLLACNVERDRVRRRPPPPRHHRVQVKAMIDVGGARRAEAPPGTPVRVAGLREVCRAGDDLLVVGDEAAARDVVAGRVEAAEYARDKVRRRRGEGGGGHGRRGAARPTVGRGQIAAKKIGESAAAVREARKLTREKRELAVEQAFRERLRRRILQCAAGVCARGEGLTCRMSQLARPYPRGWRLRRFR